MTPRWGRVAVAVLAMLSGVAVLSGPTWLAVPAGLLLGFVLPGLALTLALFRGRALNAVERTVLAPALSLAALIGAGLISYVAGYTLDRLSWTSATVGVTLVALLIAELPGGLSRLLSPRIPRRASRFLFRRVPRRVSRTRSRRSVRQISGRPVEASPAPPMVPPSPAGRIARQLIPMALVVAILGFAGWLSLSDARRVSGVTVTALSAGPPSPLVSARRAAQTTRTVQVTASGLIAGDGPYTLVVTAAHQRTTRRTLDVTGDGAWTASVALGPERTTISLYRARDTTPYRTLYIAAQP